MTIFQLIIASSTFAADPELAAESAVRENAALLQQSAENLALGASLTASSSYESGNWGIAKVIDGEQSSVSSSAGWSSNNNRTIDHTEWIQLDLGQATQLTQVDLYPRSHNELSGSGFPIAFTIQVSSDCATWTTVVTQTNYQLSDDSGQSFTFAAQNARCVKIEGTQLRLNPNDNNQYRMQFAEIELYQDGSFDSCVGAATAFTAQVTDETELDQAITCFNGVSQAGTYTISLSNDISLSQSTTPINLPDGASRLVIDGNGYQIDGQAQFGTRPLEVLTDTHVSLVHLGITGGHIAGNGSGILSYGDLSLDEVTVSGNQAKVEGVTTGGQLIAGNGGGIAALNGSLIMTDTLVTSNQAEEDGGGIYWESESGLLAIYSSQISANSAGDNGGGLTYLSPSHLRIEGSSVVENAAGDDGGGIYDGLDTNAIDIVNSELVRNTAVDKGGGVYLINATIGISETTIAENTATDGGGLFMWASYTGGVLADFTASTLAQNVVSDDGGGIYLWGGTLNLIQSTFSQNGATLSGGALFQRDGSTSFKHSTLASNSAASGGAVFNQADEPPSFYSSLLAANGGNCSEGMVSLGYNLDSDGSCGFDQASDLLVSDPWLDPLADNGGATETMGLSPFSPAIDAGPPSSDYVSDQRGDGYPRLIGAALDIGAYESHVGFNSGVSTESELSALINSFNGITQAGSYTITLSDDVDLTASLPVIKNTGSGVELIIDGDGFGVDAQGSADVRPFFIDSDTLVTLQNLTISDAKITGGQGGAIVNQGTLTIINSTIKDNVATALYGGGIHNGIGTLTLINSTMYGNAALEGAAIFNGGGEVSILNSTISGQLQTNSALRNQLQSGRITLESTIVADQVDGLDCVGVITSEGHNLDSDGSCGLDQPTDIPNGTANLGPLQANGGGAWTMALLAESDAIDAGSNRLGLATDQRGSGYPREVWVAADIGAYEVGLSDLSPTAGTEAELAAAITAYNSLGASGSYTIRLTANISLTTSTPAIQNDVDGVTLTLDGDGYVIDGQGHSNTRPLTVAADTDVILRDIGLRGGNVNQRGGGLRNLGTLLLVDSRIWDNSANNGGGGIENSGTLTVMNSAIIENAASDVGGGIYNSGALTLTESSIAYNLAEDAGGAIFNIGQLVTITDSTISYNLAEGSGTILTEGELNIINSTIAYNQAEWGAALVDYGDATSIRHSTLAYNIASGNGYQRGSIFPYLNGPTLSNTLIVVDANGDGGVACGGYRAVSSDGYNLDSDGSCDFDQPSDISNGNVNLGPLQDNGGPTLTMALLSGSDAIDAGSNPDELITDQRGEGFARELGDGPDIGAYESDILLPIAVDDSASTDTETEILIPVLDNDSDPLERTLSILSVTQPQSGSAVISGTEIRYIPASDTPGTVSFEYTISNGESSSSATVTVDVTQYNGSPVAVDDSVTVDVASSILIPVLDNDSDPEGNSLSIISLTDSITGTATISGTQIYYTADPSWEGTLTLSYEISDGDLTAEADVIITVIDFYANNVPPLAADDLVATPIDTPVTIDVLANDSDLDGDSFSIRSLTDPSSGDLALSDSRLVFTPTLGFSGIVTFTYTVEDQYRESEPATVSINVCSIGEVADEAALNAAINCYNGLNLAGTFTISLTQNISLTASTSTISNGSSGLNLIVAGNGHRVDGQSIEGVVLFRVSSSSEVRFEYIELTGGNNPDGDGGALYNAGANVTLSHVSVFNNLANRGGGIHSESRTDFFLTVINSTISGNEALSNGGGISNRGYFVLKNSTVSQNSAPGSGGVYQYNHQRMSIESTLIADQVNGADCDLRGDTSYSAGFNLDSDGTCGLDEPTDIISGTANLGPLQDNGGPTWTMALGQDSDAIDAGSNPDELFYDQRGEGFAREQGTGPDIGAYEFNPDAVTMGDVSCDDSTNTLDALYILQYDVGLRAAADSCTNIDTSTHLNTAGCDISGDGSCSTLDALYMLQCDVGLENAFCPEEE